MSKKRILVIENSVHITGALKASVHAAIDLSANFDFVFVMPTNSGGIAWVRKMGIKSVYELPMLELRKNFFVLVQYLPWLILNAIRLRRIVNREQIDLMHNNDLYNLLPVLASRVGRPVPYVCHIRFLPDKFPKFLFSTWLRIHLRFSRQVICVSKYLANMLPTHPKVCVIYDGLPLGEEHAEKLESTARLLYLSNLIKGKGQEYAIAAFAKIALRYPAWKIRFVGGDMGLAKNARYRQQLMELVEKNNLIGQVEWMDFTDDVEWAYKTAAIALNFSESESFSFTCLEALFFGCPVIATRSGGPPEIVDAETGFLIPVGDINQMASAMEELIIDPEKRAKFGKNGRKKVRAKFSRENTTGQLAVLYNGLW